ncbi:hypothetical protein PFISCL1PPCAC_636, partial [Pristionchus fissidentatus]
LNGHSGGTNKVYPETVILTRQNDQYDLSTGGVRVKKLVENPSASKFVLSLTTSFQTASEPVKESVLESITSQFDFRVFYLEFFSRNYQSVLNFALRSKKFIDRFTISSTSFSPDPHEIIQLPRMSYLCVKGMTPGFSDHLAIEIARKKHTASLIWSDLSHTTTLRRLIQMVRSSKIIREMSITVPIAYFHRFLSSIGLREEGKQLMDVSDPNSLVFWLEWEGWTEESRYYLDTGDGHFCIYGNEEKRTLRIGNRPLFTGSQALHTLDIARVYGSDLSHCC